MFGGPSRAKSIGGASFVMDVDGDRKDDDGERLLVKDPAYQVTQKKNLPEDVKQIVTVSGKQAGVKGGQGGLLADLLGWLLRRLH